MADKSNSWEDNVAGKWYVDKNCILCGVCVDVAPENFKEADAGDHAFISKQPANDEEQSACADSKDQCPVDAIGDDLE
ncbi:ferredoxin [bacterium B13(2017)]|nr:ferredoxin [bacterium B13(2017)]